MAAPVVFSPPCRYAELAARALILGRPNLGEQPPLACPEPATHRVRIEGQQPGLAFWLVAEVCVMCAHMARDLPGFTGIPQPLRPDTPAAILPRSPLPPALEAALRHASNAATERYAADRRDTGT